MLLFGAVHSSAEHSFHHPNAIYSPSSTASLPNSRNTPASSDSTRLYANLRILSDISKVSRLPAGARTIWKLTSSSLLWIPPLSQSYPSFATCVPWSYSIHLGGACPPDPSLPSATSVQSRTYPNCTWAASRISASRSSPSWSLRPV